ncbi:U-box domain-containing protein 32-like isoform X2 [Hordeum vulgare subsp. vulgare]|uniref:U-box domain-containing protein 32-like isoform X2 n=1 Tax=Hordeum vulgare subsp. vulgare TaxID=112509 RepID=UPI001D1A4AED|nr:U-box domain-containing protein 32-like isoform X2 [Hordeum vulgare subsp. vulgare]
MADSIFNAQAVPPSLVDLLPILRVAKEVEPGNFRVAYLCRLYVSEYAHRLDPTSSGAGVHQFKTLLLQTLERENMLTLKWRREHSDVREIEQFYLYYYEKFIKTFQNVDAVDKADREELAKLYQIAHVLFDALRSTALSVHAELDEATLETCMKIEEKNERYALDSILRHDPERTGLQHPEVLEMHHLIEENREVSAPNNMQLVDPKNNGVQHPEASWTYFFDTKTREISEGEGSNDSSTSDCIVSNDVFRARTDIKCGIPNVLDPIIHDGSAEPISIPLSLLQDITKIFADERKIGQGGFGVVYKGVLQNGYVAVKKLLNSQTIDDELFYRETNFLMSVKHKNIIRFLGYCANTENIAIKVDGSGKCGKYLYPEIRERLLCFEYISKGSLSNHLTDELSGLEWHIRYQTIKGICDGLQYLHKEKDIVHMDLKPDNILMDDLMVPKITDFGISKHLDGISQAVTRRCHMSLGYCAPEYLHRGQLSFKSDIFSLGVIIIDLVTGRKEDPDIENVLRRWRHRWNRSAKYPPLGYQQVTGCIEIAARCVSHDPKERPYILDIIRQLDELDCTSGHDDDANESTFSMISPYPWELLDIDPLELHFPFEAGKQILCLLQLSNPRDDYIAFYVQTSSVQYLIEPSKGIVPPQSKINVTITFQAQKMAPHRMMYKDEFVVRCTLVNQDLTTENVTEDMFDEESKVVDNQYMEEKKALRQGLISKKYKRSKKKPQLYKP